MVYIHSIKNKEYNSVSAQIFKSEDAYKKVMDNKPTLQVSSNDAKGMIRNYLTENKASLSNKRINITYLTTEGAVYLNKDVVANGELSQSDINALLGDPKTNAHENSGEYNNQLEGKTIYGVIVTSFTEPTTVQAKPSKSKYKWKI